MADADTVHDGDQFTCIYERASGLAVVLIFTAAASPMTDRGFRSMAAWAFDDVFNQRVFANA